MARATWVQTNFNGGEWSPLAYGRVDLAKFKNGLSLCQNWMPQQQGGLTRRPGTRFIAYAKSNAAPVRMQAFQFSITQAYMLEVGPYYIRIYANDAPLLATSQTAYSGATAYVPGNLVTQSGTTYVCIAATTGNTPPNAAYWYALTGNIVEIPTPFSATDVWALSFTQSADTLYIAHPNYQQVKFQRVSADNWRLVTIPFLDGPYLTTNVTSTTLIPSAVSGTVVVTASSIVGINNGLGFRAADIGRALRILCNGVWLWGTIAAPYIDTTHCNWAIAPPTGGSVPITATAVAGVSGGSVFSMSVLNGGGGYGVTPPSVHLSGGGGSGAIAYANLVDGIVAGITISVTGSGYTSAPAVVIDAPPAVATGAASFGGGAVTAITPVLQGGGYGVTPPVVTITGGGGSGAQFHAVLTNGSVTSYVQDAPGTLYTSTPTVTVAPPPALTITASTFWRLGLWNSVDGYPACVTFHQDRLCWAGAENSPNRVDCSNSGDYENMAPTNPDGTVTDSSGLGFSLNAGSVNAIAWIKSDQYGLLVGTAGSEWAVTPSSVQQALTPTNINAQEMSNYGSASSIQPIRAGRSTLFIQRTGRKVRELMYQFMLQTFQALDISLVSEHLTKGGIKQMNLQLTPQQVVWLVTNLGVLVGMTYDKDQDVCGWHWHSMGGFSDVAQTLAPVVESVATIPAPGILRDEVWLSVQRTINGSLVRTIEVMSKLWEDGDTTTYCNYLDCSAQITNGSPSTTVTGLTWLVGHTVGVLTDGAEHPPCVVSNTGSITLQWAATVVQVGLLYPSNGQTLSLEAGGTDGTAQGKMKRVFKCVFRLFQSIGLSVASDEMGVGFYPEPFRNPPDLMDNPISLKSGEQVWAYEGTYDPDSKIAFQATGPLPANITMLMAQLDTQEAL